MVMGVKAKSRRGGSVQVDYQILVQEIKPWPPSQSLRSLRSVLIQWENGDRHSGSTSQVVPTIGTVIGEGKIEFNESFRLPVTLVRDLSSKNRDSDTFQRNCLEFNLYEPRRDKKAIGQLLASAMIDLAEYGIVRESLSVSVSMNCKRTFRNTDQPILSIKIQPSEKGRNGSCLRDALSRMSLDSIGGESVSAFVNEEYAEEHEGVSSTDDDVSSHSSMPNFSSALNSSGTLPSHIEENGPLIMTHIMESGRKEHVLVSKSVPDKSVIPENGVHRNQKGISSFSSSIDLSSDPGSAANGRASISGSSNSGSVLITQNGSSNRSVSHSTLLNENLVNETHTTAQDIRENNANDKERQVEAETTPDSYNRSTEAEDVEVKCESRDERQCLEETNHCIDDEAYDTQNAEEKQVLPGSDINSVGSGYLRMESNVLESNKLKHVKSVRSPVESIRSNGSTTAHWSTEAKEVSTLGDAHNSVGTLRANESKDTEIYPKDTKSAILDGKVQKLQHRIQMLEAELSEAAAIEAALYSVVAEHGSSMSKVHAPARRLSRLYLHAWKEHSPSRRASAARSAVSGLVLIAKACGNDVPRLTFWLSNSIVLRTIISQATGDLKQRPSAGPHVERNGGNKEISKMLYPLKWKASSPTQKEDKHTMYESFGYWEDPHTFTSALGRVEAWIFSRIIESIWWQTLTPHMQSAAAKAIDKASSPGSGKNLRRVSSLTDQEQGNFSLDLWKKAFRDSCERICPLRAGGHACGCLPVLARLVMEQCVTRLDVAMFNAILRESVDEIPTDPVSDPISDPKVLPIPAGKSSFGAGAQLKNTIGNWSRWLTDLFGIDDDDQNEEENEDDHRQDTTCKSFHLLNALSDLMMLPKDLLLSRSIRKEVCPTFGAPLIKRILDNFVPDEFFPDPIPYGVLEALNSEESLEAGEESIMNFPCGATPIVYLPPSAASVFEIIGVGGQSKLSKCGSSLRRKSYNSDDELDELNSPLASILINGPQSMSAAPSKLSWISKENRKQSAIRYELFRDIWLKSEYQFLQNA